MSHPPLPEPPQPGRAALRVSAVTHPGLVRAHNEDCLAVPGWTAAGEADRWSGTAAADGFWAVLADGMGGHAAGAVASRIAVETLVRLIPGVRAEGRITPIVEAANGALYAAMADGRGAPGMGTTIVGAVFVEGEVILFNVGDSRAYLFEAGRPVWRSPDDTPEEGRPGHRSHALTACLGGHRMRYPLHPHVARLPFGEGTCLLLCSDGLTDMLPDEAIAAVLERETEAPGEALLAAALAAGGEDNVSVVVITPSPATPF